MLDRRFFVAPTPILSILLKVATDQRFKFVDVNELSVECTLLTETRAELLNQLQLFWIQLRWLQRCVLKVDHYLYGTRIGIMAVFG